MRRAVHIPIEYDWKGKGPKQPLSMKRDAGAPKAKGKTTRKTNTTDLR